MGLDLVRKLVNAMDGSISVESELGSGTTFSIDFPKHTPKPNPLTL
jgi:signal transduction histidine kinase